MRFDEFLARCLAARRIRSIKDKRGIQLPDKLWRQAMPEAEFVIEAMQHYELLRIAQSFHEAEDDGE